MKIRNGMIERKLGSYNTLRNVRMRGQAALAIAANTRALAKASEAVEDARKILFADIPDMQAYEDQRIAICEEFAERDANGRPRKSGMSYVFTTPEAARLVNDRVADLNVRYPETFQRREDAIKEYVALLDAEVEIAIQPIAIDDITGDVTPEIVSWLSDEFE